MKIRKLMVALISAMILITSGLTTIQADDNMQKGTIRSRDDVIEIVFYNFQKDPLDIDDVSQKSPLYVPVTREFIESRTQYLAFDSEGYVIPFEDIIIDEDQLNRINTDIEKGITLFKDSGKTNRGDGIDYPLVLTTPDGRKKEFTIQLNLGGTGVGVYVEGFLIKADDITYDIADGPLNWDTLKVLANARGYDPDSTWTSNTISTEVVQVQLDILNKKIADGETENVPMTFVRPIGYGNAVGYFNVNLIKTTFDVVYTDGTDSEAIFKNQSSTVAAGVATPKFDGTPQREGYTFEGWLPEVTDTVTEDVTYVAQWKKIDTPPTPTEPDKPETTPEVPKLPATGQSNGYLYLYFIMIGSAILLLSGGIRYKRSRNKN